MLIVMYLKSVEVMQRSGATAAIGSEKLFCRGGTAPLFWQDLSKYPCA